MINKNNLVTIRDYLPSDKNFIFSTWLKGLYYGNRWFKEIPKDIFMEKYHEIIEKVLSNPGVVIKIACLLEDKDVILGYSIESAQGNVLHWVFCKKAWRHVGIARSLVSSGVSTVTHVTEVGLDIINKKKIAFNPFII